MNTVCCPYRIADSYQFNPSGQPCDSDCEYCYPAPLKSPRNMEYEAQWLDHVEAEAQRRFNIDTRGYRARVEQRLAIGAERYGDDDFLRKDMIPELLEETPDVASHALLETQKRLARPEEDNGRLHHLFEAAVAGALADWHARQAGRCD